MVVKKGGNKHKKAKKVVDDCQERELVFKNEPEFQEYAQVVKALGNKRFDVHFFDGKNRLAHARGNLKKKKVFVKVGDVILVSLREFEDAKCDILYVYNPKEIKRLKNVGEIPNTVVEDISVQPEENDIGVDFGYEDKETEEELKTQEDMKKKEEFKKDFELNFETI